MNAFEKYMVDTYGEHRTDLLPFKVDMKMVWNAAIDHAAESIRFVADTLPDCETDIVGEAYRTGVRTAVDMARLALKGEKA